MNTDWNQWKVFKDKEEEYKKLRLDLEERILAEHPGERKVGNLTIAYRDTHKVDNEAAAKLDLPFNPFNIKYEYSHQKMKMFQEHYPDLYRKVQDVITVTPAKPGFVWKD